MTSFLFLQFCKTIFKLSLKPNLAKPLLAIVLSLVAIYKVIKFSLCCLALKNGSMTSWDFYKLAILAIGAIIDILFKSWPRV